MAIAVLSLWFIRNPCFSTYVIHFQVLLFSLSDSFQMLAVRTQ
jgi:hypothetical protein